MSLQFCPHCGASLAAISATYCPSCGWLLQPTAPNVSALPSPPVSPPPYIQQQSYQVATPAPAYLERSSTSQQPPEQSPGPTHITINTRLSTAIFLIAVVMSLAAALIVAVDVAYQLMHFNQPPADLPAWVSAVPPVASFLALVALVLHALAARLRKQLQRRLEAVYGASGLMVALADLPAWLRWLWPSRHNQTARTLSAGQAISATSTVGRFIAFWLTSILLITSVGVTIATPHHLFLPVRPTTAAKAPAINSTSTPASKLPTGTIKEFSVPSANGVTEDVENGLTAGPDGNMWFTEPAANQIGRITPTGAVTEFPLPTPGSRPSNITAGPDGNLWFTELDASQIGRITPAGAITEFATPTANSRPYVIITGSDGNLWFNENNQIGRITPAGAITEFAIPSSSSSGPSYLTTGPDDNLWFILVKANLVGRMTPTGVVTDFAIPTPNSGPGNLTVGPGGNLWFIEGSSTPNKIGRITPSGVITEYATPTASSGPDNLTAGPDGNLWFTEFLAGQIGRITPAGVITEFPLPTSISAPLGITAGPDGNVWFTDINANMIGRITPTGRIMEYAIPSANSRPYFITSGPGSSLWFIEQNANQIGRISP